MFKLIVWLSLSLLCVASHAQVSYRLQNTALAAKINGEGVYRFSLDNMQQLNHENTPLSRPELLSQMLKQRLLAAEARRQYTASELHPASRIAFARDVAIEDRLASSLRALYGKELEQAVKALPGETLKALFQEENTLSAEQYQAVFGSAQTMSLEYTLKPEQINQAKQITLLRYQLAGSGSLSLYDIYRRQNVQGRIELHAKNQDYLNQQIQIAFANLFTLHWAAQKFGQDAINDYRRSLKDQEDAEALMKIYGIGDHHDGSDYLTQLAKTVSPAEIRTYYQNHKNEFKRIAKVKARHIRVNDEALAKKIINQIKSGEDFAALAKRHSIASNAKDGGDLGWIIHQGSLSWLAQLALSQTELSQAFRSPVGPDEKATWEIIKVEQRVEDYQPADSESVRYAATAEIAHQKATQQFNALLKKHWQSANIEVSPSIGALSQGLK
ncbi:peptidylprolyl isomerase [Janthinobacterium sp. B9-8]|uniref:peptidylprolyl isomerase n=1 Tax=Janthinobacterium sp. B9-8 TaxID=1236179 RepID=UPI00061D34FE|nr:peptidylprolyl isomerase [Janthinobacterium sp. B9-8]AMC37019.1 hypothetical protein VN23_07625 [Janthinobacterium sp. B9-8]